MQALVGIAGPRFVLTPGDLIDDSMARRRLELETVKARSDEPVTIVVENGDAVSAGGQALLQNFLEDEGGVENCRILATAKSDLLQKVYRGEFPEFLYYRLAVLNLALRPLRDRREDIPGIGASAAEIYPKQT